jgi:hypothetical protein
LPSFSCPENPYIKPQVYYKWVLVSLTMYDLYLLQANGEVSEDIFTNHITWVISVLLLYQL